MKDLLIDIVNYLKTNSLVSGDGVDAFRDFLPDDIDNLVVLSEYAPMPSKRGIECTVRSVQVLVRNTNPDNAKALAWKIHALMNSTEEGAVYLDQTRWVIFNLRSTPFKLGMDDKQRYKWVFNVGIVTYLDYN